MLKVLRENEASTSNSKTQQNMHEMKISSVRIYLLHSQAERILKDVLQLRINIFLKNRKSCVLCVFGK